MTDYGNQEFMVRKAEKALKRYGGTHTLQDVVDAISVGRMQSFVHGVSWAVTQVLDFPRKRVLELFLVVGRMEDMPNLRDQIEAYAKHIEADLIRANGREGWRGFSKESGWSRKQSIFTKEL